MEASTNQSVSREAYISAASRVVVKVGSGVLAADGRLDRAALNRIGKELAGLRRTGREVILVSSGAVASGLGVLGLSEMPRSIADKQAAAAVGQQLLMQAWAGALAKARIPVGQVLLTAEDLDHRSRYLNARHTLQRLLAHGVLPVINENDSVSYDEIKMGDNDHLSALVAILMAADLLIMLTNVEGLHRGGPQGELIPTVRGGASVAEFASAVKSKTGVGGMVTKVLAARVTGEAGIATIIASGRREGVLREIIAGKAVGTFFEPARRDLDLRRQWIATATRVRGVLVIDNGARKAILERGASLLPSGIVEVKGRFDAGSPVRIVDSEGQVIARGLVSYASDEIDRVKGKRSTELATILGFRYTDEIIHRNDMVVGP